MLESNRDVSALVIEDSGLVMAFLVAFLLPLNNFGTLFSGFGSGEASAVMDSEIAMAARGEDVFLAKD
ncbi:hypothetical protein WICPIJ_005298 [Wickerhamomyces pijperi]|uniref:Uncharacterized protein n=1 Tax=Wickerhamomyces pijperi TaxID=599730 RepID=A0A9P8Q4C9_WICPI|nr:hypothetical protein WICPIJ_005298 [Wickerhamomyces pijperi]